MRRRGTVASSASAPGAVDVEQDGMIRNASGRGGCTIVAASHAGDVGADAVVVVVVVGGCGNVDEDAAEGEMTS